MSLIGIDDAEMNNKFIAVKNVLRKRVGAPTPQDAPPLVRDFLLALDAGYLGTIMYLQCALEVH